MKGTNKDTTTTCKHVTTESTDTAIFSQNSNIDNIVRININVLLKTNMDVAMHKRCNLSFLLAAVDIATSLLGLLQNNDHTILKKSTQLVIVGVRVVTIIINKNTKNKTIPAVTSWTRVKIITTNNKIAPNITINGPTQINNDTFKNFFLVSLRKTLTMST